MRRTSRKCIRIYSICLQYTYPQTRRETNWLWVEDSREWTVFKLIGSSTTVLCRTALIPVAGDIWRHKMYIRTVGTWIAPGDGDMLSPSLEAYWSYPCFVHSFVGIMWTVNMIIMDIHQKMMQIADTYLDMWVIKINNVSN